jgi:hypothetical protein
MVEMVLRLARLVEQVSELASIDARLVVGGQGPMLGDFRVGIREPATATISR